MNKTPNAKKTPNQRLELNKKKVLNSKLAKLITSAFLVLSVLSISLYSIAGLESSSSSNFAKAADSLIHDGKVAPTNNPLIAERNTNLTKSTDKLRVLFTHDLHSNEEEFESKDEFGNTIKIAGYARLKTLLDQERKNAEGQVITVDAGDFSMGTVMNSVFISDAPDLASLKKMGYDATTLGNHEFDFGSDALAKSLRNAAKKIENPVPIIASNVEFSNEKDSKDLQDALKVYPSATTKIIDKGGIKIGLFGVLGKDAEEDSPNRGSVDFGDIQQAARASVAELKKDGAQIIIALSHSGTDDENRESKKSEDYQLAKNVDGINFIVSGHTHSTLLSPLVVNNTVIGSADCYGQYLGEIDFSKDGDNWKMDKYDLIHSSTSVAKDADMQKFVDENMTLVSDEFLNKFGLKPDEVLAKSSETLFRTPIDKEFTDRRLGNIIANSYLYDLKKEAYTQKDSDGHSVDSQGDSMPLISVVAAGNIRDSIYKGDVTFSDAFRVIGLGEDKEDSSTGYPLAVFYLTGAELYSLAEVDATVSDLKPIARLSFDGFRYQYSKARVPLNRVTNAELRDSKGNWGSIDKNKLYPVVANTYLMDAVSLVKDNSFGLISIEPKNKNGEKLSDSSEAVVRDSKGESYKEWKALTDFLLSFSKNGKPSEIPASYFATPTQASEIGFGWTTLTKNLNEVTLIASVAVILLIVLAVLIVFLIRKSIKAFKKSRIKQKKTAL
jgi:2',3'-cyclic-nucleotide 2'-phosphodiesterase (5'-nucleotidase family)